MTLILVVVHHIFPLLYPLFKIPLPRLQTDFVPRAPPPPQPDAEEGQKQEPDDQENIGVYDFNEGDEGEPQEVS